MQWTSRVITASLSDLVCRCSFTFAVSAPVHPRVRGNDAPLAEPSLRVLLTAWMDGMGSAIEGVALCHLTFFEDLQPVSDPNSRGGKGVPRRTEEVFLVGRYKRTAVIA